MLNHTPTLREISQIQAAVLKIWKLRSYRTNLGKHINKTAYRELKKIKCEARKIRM